MRSLRQFMSIGAVIGALALGACATSGGGGGTTTPPTTGAGQQTTNIINTTISVAQKVCAFVPTAQTVAAIFASGNPFLQTANAVADAICAAVTNKSSTYGTGGPAVEGVPIKGKFLKKSLRYGR